MTMKTAKAHKLAITTLQEKIRAQAVENVDQKHQATWEFSHSPHAHRREYDVEEERLTAELAADPGRLLCSHEHRVHSLGGEIFVCFACWATALLGGRRGVTLE